MIISDEEYEKAFENGRPQMTKEEARKIFADKLFDPKFVDCLEALGLIKFEEEKIIDSPSRVIKDTIIANWQGYFHLSDVEDVADKIVNALMNASYKIVRKDAS